MKQTMLKMHDTSTVYGGLTIPSKKVKQSKVYCILHSPVAVFTVGILIGFGIGCTFNLESLTGWYRVSFVCPSDSNFTKAIKSNHLELTSGIGQFLELIEEIDESLSPYSENIIHQLNNNVRKGIADLKDLKESTKPKIRRRPPLEAWNSTATT